ncbi:MAG: hypothetical protein AAB650_01010, partial [Patescibacteria group bacterium]
AQTRRRLSRQPVGLNGPRAIQRELRRLGLGKKLPALATIKRALRAQGLIQLEVFVFLFWLGQHSFNCSRFY